MDRLKLDLGRMTQGNYFSIMLKRILQPSILLDKFARVEPMPAYKGEVIKWRRTVPFKV
jgi:hypothetical protein